MNEEVKQKVSTSAWELLKLKTRLKSLKDEYEEKKKAFYGNMKEYAEIVGNDSVSFSGYNCQLVAKKVEKVVIEWDIEKLEKSLGKSVAKKIIKKKYHVSDMEGLTRYLRLCGVDPKIFKKFIDIEKKVDEDEIERLGDTGVITVNQINNCYKVQTLEPYYTLTAKKFDERKK